MLVVRGLLHVAEQAGVSRLELQRELGPHVAQQLDNADARVPIAVVFQLADRLAELSGDSALGLRWVERLMERSFGPVAHMMVYAETLRDAFGLLAQFGRLIYDEPAPYVLLEDADTFRVRTVGLRALQLRARVFAAESSVTGFLKLVRVYFAHARPVRVCFEHAAPAHADEYAQMFGSAVAFCQPNSEIVFERALLDAPSPHADAAMYIAQRTIAERRLLQVTQDAPYAARVRELLRAQLPRRSNMRQVARELDMSERTLRSALTREGTSYRDIEHVALGSFARELLQGSRQTIQETAYQMGFSDATTFHRAVKRWTGLTPSALRASLE